jgi:hypothetical protein
LSAPARSRGELKQNRVHQPGGGVGTTSPESKRFAAAREIPRPLRAQDDARTESDCARLNYAGLRDDGAFGMAASAILVKRHHYYGQTEAIARAEAFIMRSRQ